VYGVQQLAYAVDKSQMILLRANFMAKCGWPQFQVRARCAAYAGAMPTACCCWRGQHGVD
jgi:hypothetical protein